LDKTDPNLLTWYLHSIGKSEVPEIFHHWSFISLVAATLANRVYTMKFGSRLYPNLYLMLLGSSGSGKGTAIKLVQRLAERLDNQSALNFFRGKITAQALLSRIGNNPGDNKSELVKPSNIWLVTPELGMAIGEREQARSFVKHVTELYEGDYTFVEETRTRGTFTIKDPCINWLSGTTGNWLTESVSRSDILSGFFARVQPILGVKEDNDTRYLRPVLPPDAAEVSSAIVERLSRLLLVHGEVRMTSAAQEVHNNWYMNRPTVSEHEGTRPYWERQDDIVLKLAMIFCLMNSEKPLVLAGDMEEAIAYSNSVMHALPYVQEYTWQSKHTELCAFVLEILRRVGGPTPHSFVLKKVSNRGINANEFGLLMQTLIESGQVKTAVVRSSGRNGTTTTYSLPDAEL
jgi:hypothetical protein